jgi:hypothetical protein
VVSISGPCTSPHLFNIPSTRCIVWCAPARDETTSPNRPKSRIVDRPSQARSSIPNAGVEVASADGRVI